MLVEQQAGPDDSEGPAWVERLELRIFRNDFAYLHPDDSLSTLEDTDESPLEDGGGGGGSAPTVVDIEGDAARSNFYRTGDGLNRGFVACHPITPASRPRPARHGNPSPSP